MDPVMMLQAVAAAFMTAAVVVLACTWPWRKAHPARTAAAGVLAAGLGFVFGCWWLGVRPKWPALEDQDRWLLMLFPAVIAVELLASYPGRMARLAWPLRLGIALGAAPILLHGSIYVTDLAGPGSRLWAPAQTWLILAGLGAALGLVWASLLLLTRRSPGRSAPFALTLACGGAGITIMLSGYASGGQMGLPLAAALGGTLTASLALPGRAEMTGVLGIGIVGLFTLLVIGRFFGYLSTAQGALVFFAPLLCWLPEMPYLRNLGPRFRGLGRIVLTAVPVAVALALAFVPHSTQTSPGTQEPSIEDYLNFGK